MLGKVTLEHNRVVEYYLSKVIKTSIPVMGFFSLFIGGFSMAFYLILQQVKKYSKQTLDLFSAHYERLQDQFCGGRDQRRP